MKKTFIIIGPTSIFLTVIFLLLGSTLHAQFAGAAGQPGSSAIAKDSSIIVSWAKACTVERGLINITNPFQGLASTGTESDAIGPADQSSVVSLGDSGIAILTFDHPIFNGPGPDFAVFENAFNDSFLELGYVEISSDGINYFRFPSTSLVQNSIQIGPFDQLGSPVKLNNLAGKYRSGYGTPFDLQEMTAIVGLDIDAITHIKIVDVVGSINPSYGTEDQFGNLINDPFPTAFPSGGFDLDAVGVCHMQFVNSISENSLIDFTIYPNPVKDQLRIKIEKDSFKSIEIIDNQGVSLFFSSEKAIDLSHIPSGIYQARITFANGQYFTKRITKI